MLLELLHAPRFMFLTFSVTLNWLHIYPYWPMSSLKAEEEPDCHLIISI